VTDLFHRILSLVERGEVLISDHGYDELASDDMLAAEVLESIDSAEVLEEYRIISRGRACSFCKPTGQPGRFMYYGEFQQRYKSGGARNGLSSRSQALVRRL
jgi:hypothetical protein